MITKSGVSSVYMINGKPISGIFLYENGIIHAEIKTGWLEHIPFEDGSPTSLVQDMISLDVTPVYCHICNLCSNEHFYCGNNSGYFLYLCAKVTPLGEFSQSYEDMVSYATYLQVHLSGRTRVSFLESFNIVISRRQERTSFGEEVRQLQEQLEEDGIEISKSVLSRLLKKYSIKRKA